MCIFPDCAAVDVAVVPLPPMRACGPVFGMAGGSVGFGAQLEKLEREKKKKKKASACLVEIDASPCPLLTNA